MIDDHESVGPNAEPTARAIPGRVDEHYERFDHLYGTRTAEAHRARDTETNAPVVLWTLRYPLAANSDAANRFSRRLDAISQLELLTPQIFRYGVDSAGQAYLVTDYIETRRLTDGHKSADALQRIFFQMTESIARLHENGIVLGDISVDSFALGADGIPLVLGLLGAFEIEASGTTILPPSETLRYLSPEQRAGSGADPASDIYALGVVAYRLFAGRFMDGDRGSDLSPEELFASASPPSSLRPELPIWVDDIIGRCLETRLEDRVGSASELLELLQTAHQTGVAPGQGSRWSNKTLIVRSETVGQLTSTGKKRAQAAREAWEEEERRKSGPSRGLIVMALGLIVGVVLAGVFFLGAKEGGGYTSSLEREIENYWEYAPPDLKRSMQDMIAKGATLEQRKDALSRIAASDDPVATAVLISAVKEAPGEGLRQAALQLIVERVRRNNLARAAIVLESWFRGAERGQVSPAHSPAYMPLLRACDVTLPLDGRRRALAKAFEYEPNVALQLAGALSLDGKDGPKFVPVLREFLSREFSGEPIDERGVGALILSHHSLASLFEADVLGDLNALSAQDLAWVLQRMAADDSPMLMNVVRETLRRKIVPPFQSVFLRTLLEEDRFAIPGPVKKSLVRAARGEIEERDIVAFGRWTALDVEQVLLAICAIANEDEIALSAFDTLAARSIETEPAKSLIAWVKQSFWDYRGRVVKSLGILGHSDIAAPEQVEYAFDVLMPFAKGGMLIAVMLNSEREELIKIALDRFGAVTPSNRLIPLLEHSSKAVRIAAIYSLKGRNELGVLKHVVRGYEREKDEDVRAIYREVHWVTRERSS